MAEYTIFIDESGEFQETLLGEQEGKRRPSSQIVGLLLAGDHLDQSRAALRKLPAALLRLFPLEGSDHSTEKGNRAVHAQLEETLSACDSGGWQPLRMVNNGRLGEGSVSRTYTGMVAELISRVYQTLVQRGGDPAPVLNLVYARVVLGFEVRGRRHLFAEEQVSEQVRRIGEPIYIPCNAYRDAIRRELIEDVSLGQGLDREVVDGLLGGVRDASGRRHPALRLCDLLSNCSYRGARRLAQQPVLKRRLFKSFGDFDFQLHPLDLELRAEALAQSRALGQGIALLLHGLERTTLSARAATQLRSTLTELIEDLAEEHSAERRCDLRAILDELDDLVQRQRDFDAAESLITAIEEEVFTPLEARLVQRSRSSGELDWARFQLASLSLANANHGGALRLAARRCTDLEALRATVQRRWSALPLIMESQLHRAVSAGDRFDFERAAELAQEVAHFYRDLQALVGDFEGGALLGDQPKVEERGRALSVCLQAIRARCLRGEALEGEGREIAAEALAEFSDHEDRQRIEQQLAHLELHAGALEQAWATLLRGVGVNEEAPMVLSALRARAMDQIDQLDQSGPAFPLFHILRLTAGDQRGQLGDELKRWKRETMKRAERRFPAYFAGEVDDYPAHGILRYGATIYAQLAETEQASRLLKNLKAITREGGVAGRAQGTRLLMIAAVATAEVAASLRIAGVRGAGARLLQAQREKKREPEITYASMSEEARARIATLPALARWFERLDAQVTTLHEEESLSAAEKLLKICAELPD
ncbi:MAG: hypothetical protein VYD19_02415 [Myxococcota bacterium]|nr:hypothetical protein [Myxococcota bacterium]